MSQRGVYYAYIYRNAPDKHSYTGLPETVDHEYELTRDKLERICAKLPGKPILYEHKGKQIGKVLEAFVDEGGNGIAKFQLDTDTDTVSGQLGALHARVIDLEGLKGVSLCHDENHATGYLEPVEVSLCFEPAREGTHIISTSKQGTAMEVEPVEMNTQSQTVTVRASRSARLLSAEQYAKMASKRAAGSADTVCTSCQEKMRKPTCTTCKQPLDSDKQKQKTKKNKKRAEKEEEEENEEEQVAVPKKTKTKKKQQDDMEIDDDEAEAKEEQEEEEEEKKEKDTQANKEDVAKDTKQAGDAGKAMDQATNGSAVGAILNRAMTDNTTGVANGNANSNPDVELQLLERMRAMLHQKRAEANRQTQQEMQQQQRDDRQDMDTSGSVRDPQEQQQQRQLDPPAVDAQQQQQQQDQTQEQQQQQTGDGQVMESLMHDRSLRREDRAMLMQIMKESKEARLREEQLKRENDELRAQHKERVSETSRMIVDLLNQFKETKTDPLQQSQIERAADVAPKAMHNITVAASNLARRNKELEAENQRLRGRGNTDVDREMRQLYKEYMELGRTVDSSVSGGYAGSSSSSSSSSSYGNPMSMTSNKRARTGPSDADYLAARYPHMGAGAGTTPMVRVAASAQNYGGGMQQQQQTDEFEDMIVRAPCTSMNFEPTEHDRLEPESRW